MKMEHNKEATRRRRAGCSTGAHKKPLQYAAAAMPASASNINIVARVLLLLLRCQHCHSAVPLPLPLPRGWRNINFTNEQPLNNHALHVPLLLLCYVSASVIARAAAHQQHQQHRQQQQQQRQQASRRGSECTESGGIHETLRALLRNAPKAFKFAEKARQTKQQQSGTSASSALRF